MQKYQHAYGPNTTYGHVMRLIERSTAGQGLVFDLGCGRGPLAEPLTERGFTYFGVDIDRNYVRDLASRGFSAASFDLRDTGGIVELLRDAIETSNQPLAAVLLLDVLEHLSDPAGLLIALRHAMTETVSARLVVSVPNVTHFDVAASLLRGQWNYTPEGLLDETHLRFFSELGLQKTFARAGWIQTDALDFELPESEQSVNGSIFSGTSALAEFLRRLRQSGPDRSGRVYQFVRMFIPTTIADYEGNLKVDSAGDNQDVGVSVVLRTKGDRPDLLDEALLALAAQTDDRFEVLLMVHSRDVAQVAEVRRAVGEFAPAFSRRVRIKQVIGGDRARPLNEGLRSATGRYVAFLDDDDCVAANWIESFLGSEPTYPGQIVRSIVADQSVERTPMSLAPYKLLSGPMVDPSRVRFDLVRHLAANRTPICGFAVPRRALIELGLEFNEARQVLEDWEFLLSAAMVCGVTDTGHVTSFYRRWSDTEASFNAIDRSTWADTRVSILHDLDSYYQLLPPGSIRRLMKVFEERDKLRQRIGQLRRDRAEYDERKFREVSARLAAIESSTSWRVTRPLRWLGDIAKGRKRQ